MPIFRVGSENGGREAGEAIAPLHKALNNTLFFTYGLDSYFKTLEFFMLAVRVSGRTKDFKGEGPEDLKKERGTNCYGIDLVIPEKHWNGVPFGELREYVVEGVRQCFELCVTKARKSGELLDEDKLRSDFEAGIREILDANEKDDLFHKSRGLDILNSMIAEAEKAGQPVDKQALMQKMQAGIFTV
jgi:hypothetical protein